MIKIVDIADQVWRDLNTPPDVQIPYIATWFRNNIGKLNNNIATNLVVDKATQEIISKDWYQSICKQPPPICNTPPHCEAHAVYFGVDEADIYKEIFKVKFYEDTINKLLYAGLGNINDFNVINSVQEGDSIVKKSSQTRNDIAKTYLQFKKDANDRLTALCHLYKFYRSQSQQVTGDDFITPFPFSSVGYFGYGPGNYY